MAATPEPESEALRETCTAERNQLAGPAVPDRVAVDTGGIMSGFGSKYGAQETRGTPRPAPSVPFEAAARSHVAKFQLSTTFKAPKIRSMSRDQGALRLGSLIGKPQYDWNSVSTRPAGLRSVQIAYTDQAASSTV